MNVNIKTTIVAAEDLGNMQYQAIALDDGKLANNAGEALGIILGKPDSGDHATVGYLGEMFYKAGGAVTKGAKLTVTTSGFLITATSGYTYIGVAKDTISSGSIGTGIFSFPVGYTLVS